MGLPVSAPESPTVSLEALLGGRFLARPEGRILLGGGLALAAGTLFSGILAAQGSRVLFVDGANAFDPYIVARYARRIGLHPKDLLDRQGFLLSRVFTCHQLTVLLEERVWEHLERGPACLILSGLLNTFMDESVPLREVRALFQRLLRALQRIGRETSLLLAQPPIHGSRERQPFLRELACLAETVASVEEDERGLRVRLIRPVAKVLRPGAGESLHLLARREDS